MTYLPRIYPICKLGQGQLLVMPAPMGGVYLLDGIAHLADLGISTVVSLLDQAEVGELNLWYEELACQQYQIGFHNYPISNGSVPDDFTLFLTVLEEIYQRVVTGKDTVIHCYGGIGRSGLFAVSLLIRHGIWVNEALACVSKGRGMSVPETAVQFNWLTQHASRIHNRGTLAGRVTGPTTSS